VTLGSLATGSLRRHHVNQAAERLFRGPLWEDQGLIFANEVGKPIEATNLLRRSFAPLLECAGLPRIRFHDLRHSAATLLLGQGVEMKIVQELLGHSSISITADIYGHVLPPIYKGAMDKMDGFLDSGSS